jgi:predicted nucleic acid-binding protein
MMAGTTMPLVIDASVAVKFLVRESGTDKARTLLASPEPLIAPDWLLVEAANTFFKKVKRSELLQVHAVRHLQNLPEFFETLFPAYQLLDEALRHAFRLRHAVYDCLYLALALREGCALVTADEKFAAAVVRGGYGETLMRLE